MTNAPPRTRSRPAVGLVPFLAVGVGLSLLGFISTTPALSAWFVDGPHAEWTPQIWVFAAVWTVLYLVDAVAGWLIWRASPSHRDAIGATASYWAQIVLQAAWLVAFLAEGLVGGASLWIVFAVIVVLDIVTLIAAVIAWRVSRAASLLLALMVVWLLFGTVLSGADTLLQSGAL